MKREALSAAQALVLQGREEGREKGMEEGREKGMEEGREKGLGEGAKRTKIETALRMMDRGFSHAEIADLLDLNEESIRELAK